MHCVTAIENDIFYIGASDRRLALFENVYPIPDGVSYNSYLINDEKTVLLDTVDKSVSERFFENLEYVLAGKCLDYVIVNHMEPDHAATLGELVLRYPGVKVIGTAKTKGLIKQFFNFDIDSLFTVVSEGSVINTGRHTLHFVSAPMVHWPEVMVTYDEASGILFSADAFGTFGALNGSIYADEVGVDESFISEARRYYTNIVGKYGSSVVSLLKKAQGLAIKKICPLHGPIFRKDIGIMVDKYMHWATYSPEDSAVIIPYGTIYNNTENAACILATELAALGVTDVKLYDVSKTHHSYILAEAFRCSHIVFASATYNNGIFSNMEYLLHDLAAHNLSFRKVAVIENGSWSPKSGEKMKEILSGMNGMTILQNNVTFRSSPNEDTYAELKKLAREIADSIQAEKTAAAKRETPTADIEREALFKLSYGLFVLSASSKDKDNGCIINTAMQITDTPCRIAVALNKNNYTHDMISESGIFNISVLSQKVEFDLFKRFGFASGRDVDKFSDFADKKRAANGVYYLSSGSNAYLSAKVITSLDCGTHTLFIADVTEAKVLNGDASATYEYYFSHIKPKSGVDTTSKGNKIKGYICKICGFIYEGETLPEDFICPICNHTAEDFEPIYESDEKPADSPKDEPVKEEGESGTVKAYKCGICGYVYEASELPEGFTCPNCGVGAELFEPVYEASGEENVNSEDDASSPSEVASDLPKTTSTPKKGYICTVCGYVYEESELPEDFTCPLCGVGADMFEPVYEESGEEGGNSQDDASSLSEETSDLSESALENGSVCSTVCSYVCTVCGYVYEGSELPEDFTCPICGVGTDMFHPLYEPVYGASGEEGVNSEDDASSLSEEASDSTEAASAPKKSYVCTVCGYVYEGSELPEDFTCPLCGVGADMFEPKVD